MKVTLPDGSLLELPDGATGADAARAIGEGLARAALGVRQNGDLRDLDAPLAEGPVEIVTAKDPRTLSPFLGSSATTVPSIRSAVTLVIDTCPLLAIVTFCPLAS